MNREMGQKETKSKTAFSIQFQFDADVYSNKSSSCVRYIKSNLQIHVELDLQNYVNHEPLQMEELNFE